MIEHSVLLPYSNGDGEYAFHWLCFHMKGKFTYQDEKRHSTKIIFKNEEDKTIFILKWGEYLK